MFLLKCSVALYQGNFAAAIDAVRQGLRLFGVELPSDPDAIGAGIGAGIGKMQAHLARTPVEQLHELPELADPGLSVAMQLLFNVVPAAIMISPPLFVLAELSMFDLALSHGLSAVCAKNFVDCGMIQGQFLGDYATAYRLGKAAFRVLDRFGARTLGTSVHFVFAGFVSAWGAPYEEAISSCQIGKKLSIESGETLHLGYHNVLYPRLLLMMGRTLPECLAECREAMALVTRLRASVQAIGVRLCQHAVERLTDTASTSEELARAEAALESEIVSSGNHQWAFQGGEVQLFASVVLADWEGALRWSSLARGHEMAGATYLAVPEFHLLECLLTARQRWLTVCAEGRAALLAECRERRDKLQRWALGCPENHEPSFALAAAEVARLEGEPMAAVLAHYERATRAAGQRFIHLHALGLELTSGYLREQGSEGVADGVLERAMALYAHWGAAAKVKRLAAQHPRLFSRGVGDAQRGDPQWSTQTLLRGAGSGTIGVSHLDLESLLAATQAISGEVKTARLYALLMHTMAENAGAERGCLVLADEGGNVGLVYARTELGQGGACAPAQPDEQQHRLCLAVLRYVARTQRELIIDDASAHPRYSREPYVQANGVKSVLCLPVLHQGRLSAVLYLENSATTHAFTADRVHALRVLGGQAAISIANAQLYATLEQRVDERTRALSAKTRKVEAMLHGIHQGVFTIDADLRVQPEYSEHLPRLLGKHDIVGHPVDELLFDGTLVSSVERSRNDSALFVAFGAPRNIAELNTSHLIKEFRRREPDGTERVFEVDWNWIVGETQRVESVLVTLRDVSVVRALAQQVARAEHEATLIARVIDVGADKFFSFCGAAHARLAEAVELLSSPATLGTIGAEAVFRALHTLKGNAGMLGLDAIVRAAHDAEDRCRPAGDGALDPERGQALAAVRALDQLVAENEALVKRKLGSSRPSDDARQAEALARIEARLAQAPERGSPVISELRAIIDDLRAVPLKTLFEDAARNLPALAGELHKAAPALDCQDGGLRLSGTWARVLADVLVHVLRNSLDHGIEPPDERLAAGKPAKGRLFLRVERGERGVRLRLGDDGRGLALERLREKAGGQPCTDDELAELTFAFGISTAEQLSTISGRGVGMDAVRSELRRHGGDAAAEFTGPARDGHRPFALVLSLPADALSEPRRALVEPADAVLP